MALVPDPPRDRTIVFQGNLLTDRDGCPILGLGLREALAQEYGRPDMRVTWYPRSEEIPDSLKDPLLLLYDYRAKMLVLAPQGERGGP